MNMYLAWKWFWYTHNCLGCEIASHSELPKQWWCAGVNDHGVEDWHLI